MSLLLAESSGASICLILGLLFLVAALVWLIIWLLFGCCKRGLSETKGDGDGSSENTDEDIATKANEETTVSRAEVEETDGGEDEIQFKPASEDEARELFAAELEAGSVSQDPVYGIIYNSAPDGGVDDLKRIKGVAEVLEGKLNDMGVYRFKQIAVWTDAACGEFSEMLTFKDRIYRDNWIAQAKDFHEEKYEEKL